jgi:hypothetical protein
MKQFKLRGSKGGDFLTAGRKISKGETPRSYVKEWFISQMTGKKKTINSKYLRRGIEVEDLAIERISKKLGIELKKNEKSFEDEFFTGTPDVITKDCIIDAKSSWDAFTFPYFMEKPPLLYEVQLQIYMYLTGIKKSKLAYCLENGTEEQINKLAWQKASEVGYDEPTIKQWDEAEADLNYDHLDDNLRIRIFEIQYDQGIIDNLKESVEHWREYIESDLLTMIELNK